MYLMAVVLLLLLLLQILAVASRETKVALPLAAFVHSPSRKLDGCLAQEGVNGQYQTQQTCNFVCQPRLASSTHQSLSISGNSPVNAGFFEICSRSARR